MNRPRNYGFDPISQSMYYDKFYGNAPQSIGESVLNSVPVLGPIIGGIVRNRQAVSNAREQRDWLKDMAGSAHQREVADLDRAHLSKIIAYGGTGAETPSTGLPDAENVLGDSVTNATQLKLAKASIQKTKSDVNLNTALQTKALAEANKAYEDSEFTNANKGVLLQRNVREQIRNDQELENLKQNLANLIQQHQKGEVDIGDVKLKMLQRGYQMIKHKKRKDILSVPVLGHTIVLLQEILGTGGVTPIITTPMKGDPKVKPNKNPIGFRK